MKPIKQTVSFWLAKGLTAFGLFLFGCNTNSVAQSGFYDVSTIQEIRITFAEANWDYLLDSMIQVGDGTGRLIADVVINGQDFPNSAVRYKGFSSWQQDEVKNPFNIELDFPAKNRNYKGYSKLKLSNVIQDPSFVREVLAYRIARKYMPASMANYAKVFVNGKLMGLYTNVEAVDKYFVKKFFDSDENAFFKGSPASLQYPFGQNANLAYTHGSDTLDYMPYYKMESDGGWGELLSFIYTLNYDTANLESVLDVDRTLWMHAFNYSVLNLDSYIGYCQNYYLYKDDNGRFNPIVWDLNMSFGSFRNSDGTQLSLSIPKMKSLNPLQHLYSPTYTPRPLTKNLFQNPRWRKMYLAHMRTIINENIRNNDYYNYGLQVQSLIDSAVQEDTNKFYSYSYFLTNIDTTVGSGISAYPGLKEIMDGRVAYLDTFPGFSNPPVITQIENQPVVPQKEQMIWITAKITNAEYASLGCRFRTGGVFLKTEMYDDGNHNDGIAGDSIFGAGVMLGGDIMQYYIWAENDTSGVFSPERAEYEFHVLYPQVLSGDLVINEFYNNWIELFNTTQEPMMVSGLYLSDDPANPQLWQIPDTLMNAGGYLIFHTLGSGLGSSFSTTLRLNDGGGRLFISSGSAEILDSVRYNLMYISKSTGRYPNGYGPFQFLSPTYSQYNVPAVTLESDLTVYPNPAADKVFVEMKKGASKFSLEIFNSEGEIVYSESFDMTAFSLAEAAVPIDVTNLGRGVYFVRMISEGETFSSKLVID